MPRQNRVTPFGEMVAIPQRGTLMGNRGQLHDREGRVKRAWQVKRWLICVLQFRGRKRTVMSPGQYTELFFLDEATALAAGHRPCFECQRQRYLAFRDAWIRGNEAGAHLDKFRVADMDEPLHRERLAPDRSKRTYGANLDRLRNGVFVVRPEEPEKAYLVWDDCLLEWSPGGYRKRLTRPKGKQTMVLTPRSTVQTIAAGFVPGVHPTARLKLQPATM
jgi:hypothetical protein